MTIRTIIVDDESLARKGLKLRLQSHSQIEVIGECSNGREAIEVIQREKPDLVFLDIQMPGKNGFDVVRELQSDSMPVVVFVTAFGQYALDAFDVRAVDYVLKPIEDERLARAIERVEDALQSVSAEGQKQRLVDLIVNLTGKSAATIDELAASAAGATPWPDRLAIKDGGEIELVTMTEIEWIDAAGDYMCVHANGKTHIMRSTMKELEKQLNPAMFQRVHRSTIVNLSCVEKVVSHINGEFNLVLSSGAQLKMSRSYKEKIKHFV